MIYEHPHWSHYDCRDAVYSVQMKLYIIWWHGLFYGSISI